MNGKKEGEYLGNPNWQSEGNGYTLKEDKIISFIQIKICQRLINSSVKEEISNIFITTGSKENSKYHHTIQSNKGMLNLLIIAKLVTVPRVALLHPVDGDYLYAYQFSASYQLSLQSCNITESDKQRWR